jgi:predicted  nucleic acid-binding Zn-ribbon protein
MTKLLNAREESEPAEVARLEAQVADLKAALTHLQRELADMREQRDRWHSRAERVSLVSPC